MTHAQDTPIYKDAYDLLVIVMKLTQNFPRNFKNGIARDLSLYSQRIITLIFKINTTNDSNKRLILLDDMREYITLIMLLLRASTDLKLISPTQLGMASEKTVSISKQIQGWINYTNKKIQSPD